MEWGVPLRDPHRLFELLCLEGAQAGLAWITILRKRDGYRSAFDGFDVERMAAYGDADRARLLADAGIVRNRAKVDAFIGNATAWRSLDDPVGLIWSFVGGAPIVNRWRTMDEVPAQTDASLAMSRELRGHGLPLRGPHHLLRASCSPPASSTITWSIASVIRSSGRDRTLACWHESC